MIWRHILIGGAAIAIGQGAALNSDGQITPMVTRDTALSPRGGTEYAAPYPKSSARGSFDTRHRIQEDDE